ncbi:MAG: omptin family outer membrane protease [Treponema sp.]|jgi:outer membrane protease|nr:omptin family outer membrane protease [Treponema sp.]
MRGAFAFFMLFSAGFLYAQKTLSVSVETGGGILFGDLINYEQIIWMPLLSAEFKYHLQDWTFGASGAFFPYVWADSLDTYFLRQVQFYDKMSGGIGGSCTVFVNYTNAKFNYISFGFSGSIDIIRNTTGKTSAGKIGAVENEIKKSSDSSKFESENRNVEFTVKLSR